MSSWVYYLFGLGSVLVADISQLILKKAAVREYKSWLRSYLNFQVIFAYGLFFLSTILNVLALRRLPLSISPVWQSMGQVFVALLSYFVLRERITRRKLAGMLLIICGILCFVIQ